MMTPTRTVPRPPRTTDAAAASLGALADILSSLRELHRERQDFHSAEKRMTLQVKAIQRRLHARACPLGPGRKKCGCEGVYDVVTPTVDTLTAIRDGLNAQRKRPEKAMQKLAEQLPVWEWWESTRGLGALGLAQIIAECGDLAQYGNPAKLWKRMGLGMYQRTDGQWERQRKAEGDNGVLAGYSPTRRSIMFVLGESIIKAGGPYREVYDQRKVLEAEKPACGRAKCTGEHCQPGHIHNRAKRYTEKRLLKDLWRRWRAKLIATSTDYAPAIAPELIEATA